jgi:hypothetical protein
MEIEKSRNIKKRSVQIEPFQVPVPLDIPRSRSPFKNPQQKRRDRVQEIFRDRNDIEILQKTGFRGGSTSRRRGFQLVAWSWLAAFIDSLILISISCVFLLIFAQLAKQLHLNGSVINSFLFIYGLCLWVYMVSLRVFAGHTIGEWACDLRLGQPHERMRLRYPFCVIFRVGLVLCTGVLIFPCLALIFGRDIVGKISGVQLFSLK